MLTLLSVKFLYKKKKVTVNDEMRWMRKSTRQTDGLRNSYKWNRLLHDLLLRNRNYDPLMAVTNHYRYIPT